MCTRCTALLTFLVPFGEQKRTSRSYNWKAGVALVCSTPVHTRCGPTHTRMDLRGFPKLCSNTRNWHNGHPDAAFFQRACRAGRMTMAPRRHLDDATAESDWHPSQNPLWQFVRRELVIFTLNTKSQSGFAWMVLLASKVYLRNVCGTSNLILCPRGLS